MQHLSFPRDVASAKNSAPSSDAASRRGPLSIFAFRSEQAASLHTTHTQQQRCFRWLQVLTGGRGGPRRSGESESREDPISGHAHTISSSHRASSSCSSRCLQAEANNSTRHMARRSLATASASAGGADASAPPPASANADPKLVSIVDQIEKLTLLEASELVTQLKVSVTDPC